MGEDENIIARLDERTKNIQDDVRDIKATLKEMTLSMNGLQQTQNVHGTDIIKLKDDVQSLKKDVKINRDWRIKFGGIMTAIGAVSGIIGAWVAKQLGL